MKAPAPNLRRVWNPPNPYLTKHRELLGEPPVSELEVYQDPSRSILSHNDSPDLGFRWSVNPYRGCFHACAYCYARPTHEYLGLGAGTDFERKIFVKPRAPELLERAFRGRKWSGEVVAFSGVTDCYQPLEASWNLTRGCLEVCLRHSNAALIVTKSQLVRRDRDLLAEMARRSLVRVSLSIPFLDEEIARKLEPGAPSIKRRFETMRALADSGVPVAIAVAPIIPGLNDSDIPELLERAKAAGATVAWKVLLRLPGSVREVFFHRLAEELPLKASRIEGRLRDTRGGKLSETRFGKRHSGEGAYWSAIDRIWDVTVRKLGLSPRPLIPEGLEPGAPRPLHQMSPGRAPERQLRLPFS